MKTKREKQIIKICLELLQQDGETIETVLARFPDQAGRIRPLLEAALWLEDKRAVVEPRPGFIAASGRRLSARLHSAHAQSADRSRGWRRSWTARLQYAGVVNTGQMLLRVTVLLLLVASVLLNGYQAVQATHTSLPGDLVYPLKVVQESVQLAFTLDPAGATRLHTRYAQLRLLEVQALVFEGRYEHIPATVADFENHVGKAIRALGDVAAQDQDQALSLAADLQVALTSQTGLVAILSGMTPQTARPQFERVRLISEQGIIQVEGLFLPSGWLGAPRAVGGGAGHPSLASSSG